MKRTKPRQKNAHVRIQQIGYLKKISKEGDLPYKGDAKIAPKCGLVRPPITWVHESERNAEKMCPVILSRSVVLKFDRLTFSKKTDNTRNQKLAPLEKPTNNSQQTPQDKLCYPMPASICEVHAISNAAGNKVSRWKTARLKAQKSSNSFPIVRLSTCWTIFRSKINWLVLRLIRNSHGVMQYFHFCQCCGNHGQ